MLVKDLIEKLQQLDPNAELFVDDNELESTDDFQVVPMTWYEKEYDGVVIKKEFEQGSLGYCNEKLQKKIEYFREHNYSTQDIENVELQQGYVITQFYDEDTEIV